MKQRLSFLTTLLVLLFLFGIYVSPAEAHANLVQSVPEANAMLDRSPVQVELFMSEPLESGFSTIEVLDLNGSRVDNGDVVVDPVDPLHMTVSLRSLPDGIYTVSWRALSSVDSHITAGAFPFGVGDVDAAALAAAAQAGQQVNVSPGEIVARWLTYLAVMVLAGGTFFQMIIWQPARRQTGLGANLSLPWPRLVQLALLLLLLANALWLLIQSGLVTGAEIAAPWHEAVRQILFTTRFGAQWLARLVLALAILFLLPRDGERRARYASLAAALLLLLTISLGSHAAATPEPLLPIVADWLHLIGASFWVGGLVLFVVALYALRTLEAGQRARLTSVLIPRFSALALVCVSLLLLSGVYATWLHVGSVEGLTGTPYGRTLMIKLALFVPMVLLGAVNLLVTSPNMKQAAENNGPPGLVQRFRRLVSSEVALAAAVLLSVGVLTTLPPADSATTSSAIQEEQEVDDLDISLEVVPGRVGLNSFEVTVLQDGQPLDGAREVVLQFTAATSDLPPSEAQLSAQGAGVYSIEGGFISLPDVWQLQVAVRRTDAFDSFANFDLNFGGGGGSAVQAFPWHQVTGVLVLLAAIIYLFALEPLAHSRRQAYAYGRVPAVALAIIGLLVFFRPPVQQESLAVNPIPPNADSLAEGEVLYLENCLPCHGATGAGDGPVGRTLNPPPADLTQHTIPGVHPDGRLFNWISQGVQGSVMPAFEGRLSEEERWHLVNYIRTLAVE